MNILARHIKAILLAHDHVALPQFGTFFTDTEAAGRETDDVFMPMRRVLRFTSEIDDTDELLLTSLADTYHLTAEQAHERLDKEIADAGQTLASTGTLDFDTLGTFNLVGGRIVFEACKASFVVPEMYGLDALSMPQLPTLTANEEKEQQKQDKNSYVIRINREFVHYAACIAATIALFFVCGTPIGNQTSGHSTKNTLSGIFMPHIDRPDLDALTSSSYIAVAEQAAEEADELVEEPTTEESAAAEVKEKAEDSKANVTPATSKEQTLPFTVCLASGVTKKGAENYVEILAKTGYDKARVMTRGKMTRVVYGEFATYEEAQKVKEELRISDQQFATVWVFEIK